MLIIPAASKVEVIDLIEALLKRACYVHLKPDQINAIADHLQTLRVDRRDINVTMQFGVDYSDTTFLKIDIKPFVSQ